MSTPAETPTMASEEASLVHIPRSSDNSLTEGTQKAENLPPATALGNRDEEPLVNDPAQVVEDERQSQDEDSGNSSTSDVPIMDWIAFEANYKKALTDANEVEDQLVLEFEKLSKHDNDRAWKRLKTRERYVQLSEHKLEEKKKHYVEVVQAFQNALKLLGA